MLRHSRPRGTVVATLAVAWMCSVITGNVEAKARAIPCPDEADILPCVCTSYPDFSMDMDCSAVTSSNQLALALNADFPFSDFKNLYIRNNSYVKTLRIGDLGQITFERITISGGELETIVDTALINNYGTLQFLDLSDNVLFDFPFGELSSFMYLQQLNMENNRFSSLPEINSTSLRVLLMGYNPLRSIPVTALQNIPNLEEVSLASTMLTDVLPGTMIGLFKLQVVHLEFNSLTTLRANTIQLNGPSTVIHINNNSITSIETNAIQGANYQVWAFDNLLTELPEDVWRPMFDAGIRLSVRNNDLICGCDIAWIVLNVNYLAHLVDDPQCANGDYIYDLDPSIFLELCP